MELLAGQGPGGQEPDRLLISYLDASLVLNAVVDDGTAKAALARSIILDTRRKLMVSDYVRLETLPKMRFHKQEEQVLFTQTVFRNAIYIRSTSAIIERAHELSETYGLAALDALHAASAIEGGADELLTFEKPTKPFFRIPPHVLKVISLHETRPVAGHADKME